MCHGTIEGAPRNTPGNARKGVLQDLNKDVQEGVFEAAFKGALDVALELHLLMHLPMHKSAPNDSIIWEIQGAQYAALQGTPLLSGAFKISQNGEDKDVFYIADDGPIKGVLYLRVHLRLHLSRTCGCTCWCNH